jgi:hypothetical protein
VIATPFASTTSLLVSRAFARAGERGRLVLAISGWIVLLAAVVLLMAAFGWMFPNAAEA